MRKGLFFGSVLMFSSLRAGRILKTAGRHFVVFDGFDDLIVGQRGELAQKILNRAADPKMVKKKLDRDAGAFKNGPISIEIRLWARGSKGRQTHRASFRDWFDLLSVSKKRIKNIAARHFAPLCITNVECRISFSQPRPLFLFLVLLILDRPKARRPHRRRYNLPSLSRRSIYPSAPARACF